MLKMSVANNNATDDESCTDIRTYIAKSGINDLTATTTVKVLFTIVYTLLFLLGIVGNGGVITAVARNHRLQSARNIFLLNLMLTDLLLCLTAIPVTPWYGLTKTWMFGALMCRLMPLSNSCSVFVTSWSLTAIAADKYIHILDSTRAPIRLREAGVLTILIWVTCSVINVPYLMSYGLVNGSWYVRDTNLTPFCGLFCDEINWSSEMHRRLYGSAVMLLQFVVPLAIITFCYSRILAKVGRDMIVHNVQFSSSLSSNQRIEAMNRKRRVNYILIAMVATFMISWFPLTAVNVLKDFRQEPNFIRTQPYLWPLIAHAIAMTTVILNPVLFFWLTRKQKTPRVARLLAINTADMISSFADRISRSNTFQRASTIRSHIGGGTPLTRRDRKSTRDIDKTTNGETSQLMSKESTVVLRNGVNQQQQQTPIDC